MTASDGGLSARSSSESCCVVAKCVGSDERISLICAIPAFPNWSRDGVRDLEQCESGARENATTKSILENVLLARANKLHTDAQSVTLTAQNSTLSAPYLQEEDKSVL